MSAPGSHLAQKANPTQKSPLRAKANNTSDPNTSRSDGPFCQGLEGPGTQ